MLDVLNALSEMITVAATTVTAVTDISDYMPTVVTELASLPKLQERAEGIIKIGGPVVVILFLMSFIATTIVIAKLLQFGWLRIGQRQPAIRALRHWRAGEPEQALALVSRHRSPIAQILSRAIRGQQNECLTEHAVREEVLRYGNDLLFQLRRGLRPLEVIGSLAPLLGLLGTVLGMIKAFQQLEAAGNKVNPAILSGGIWEALLTTAVGLCVAIPVVALLNWLERRVDHLAHDMDNLVTQVFTTDLADAKPAHTHADQLPSQESESITSSTSEDIATEKPTHRADVEISRLNKPLDTSGNADDVHALRAL